MVEYYDYDNDRSHDLIGMFQTTMTKLKEASRISLVEFECFNKKKRQNKKGYKNSGGISMKQSWWSASSWTTSWADVS